MVGTAGDEPDIVVGVVLGIGVAVDTVVVVAVEI